jgi:hypothetical protein
VGPRKRISTEIDAWWEDFRELELSRLLLSVPCLMAEWRVVASLEGLMCGIVSSASER